MKSGSLLSQSSLDTPARYREWEREDGQRESEREARWETERESRAGKREWGTVRGAVCDFCGKDRHLDTCVLHKYKHKHTHKYTHIHTHTRTLHMLYIENVPCSHYNFRSLFTNENGQQAKRQRQRRSSRWAAFHSQISDCLSARLSLCVRVCICVCLGVCTYCS